MQYTRETAIEKLLESYKSYFNVTEQTREDLPIVALCEFYEQSQKYVLSKKAELWSYKSEEFCYLFSVQRLTKELLDRCVAHAYEDGMNRAHIGPGHMYTYVTPIIICESMDEDAAKAIKKCRIYKSFRFSFHGWLDVHVAALDVTSDSICTNKTGRCVEKILKSVLYKTKKRRNSI